MRSSLVSTFLDPPFKKRGRRPLKDKHSRPSKKRTDSISDDDYDSEEDDDEEIEAKHCAESENESPKDHKEHHHKHTYTHMPAIQTRAQAKDTTVTTTAVVASAAASNADAYHSSSSALKRAVLDRNQVNKPVSSDEVTSTFLELLIDHLLTLFQCRFLAVTNRNGYFVSVTREFAALLGYEPSELVGSMSHNLHPEELRPLYQSFMQMMLETASTK